MARIRIAGTSGASENTIVFSPAGGHSHNGQNSSLIDSTAYSMYDFSPTFVGTEVNPDRAVRQENNRIALEDTIKRVVNNSVLAPAGIRLEQGSLNGSLIIANTITANQLAANTITAAEIFAGTITANELSSNIVLINNVIRSNNYNGTIAANGAITVSGNAGWAITSFGSAEFANTSIRGALIANSVSTPGIDLNSDGSISSTNFNVTATGNVTATNANIVGIITSGSGSIGGWTIDSNSLFAGTKTLSGSFAPSPGEMTIGSDGHISAHQFLVTSNGNLKARNGTLGPFDFTVSGMNSIGYNAQNFMQILDYGDLYIYSAPVVGNGPHGGMTHTTALVGEYMVIGRTDLNNGTAPVTTNRYLTVGDGGGYVGHIGIEIIENNVSRFRVYEDGNVTAAGFIAAGGDLTVKHGGIDGGIVIRPWTGSASFLSIATANMAGGEYMMISEGTNTFISSGAGGGTYIRGPENSVTHSVACQADSATLQGSWQIQPQPVLYGNFDYLGRNIATGGITVSLSNRHLKENIVPISGALDTINKLSPSSFNWKIRPEMVGNEYHVLTMQTYKSMGFIVEDVVDVSPELVTWRVDEKDWSYYAGYWKTDDFIALAIQGIKDLHEKILFLENEVKALKGL